MEALKVAENDDNTGAPVLLTRNSEMIESDDRAPRGTQILQATSRTPHRKLLAGLGLGITVGFLLPLALLMPLYSSNAPQAAEMPAHMKILHIPAVVGSKPLQSLDVSEQIKTETAAAKVSHTASAAEPVAPSNIVDYAAQQEIPVQARQYTFIKGGPRLYEPEITFEPIDGKGKEIKISANELRQMQDGSGRYRSDGSEVEWQGAWSFDNAEKNLKLGSSYTEYLDRAFGSFGNKLSVVDADQAKLLRGIELHGAGPTGAK